MKDPIIELFNVDANFITQILVRMLIVFLISTVLGIERARKRHTAGLRTFILVAVSSTVAGIIDYYLINKYGIVFPIISASLCIGLAILSSYSIIYSSKGQIKGLTTSVALWTQAIFGIAIGFGLYTPGLLFAIILFVALQVLPILEIYLKNRSNHFEIHLELKNKTDLPQFTTVVRELGLIIDDIEANQAYINTGLSVYTISLSIYSKELKKYKTHKEIIEALRSIEYIYYIEEMIV